MIEIVRTVLFLDWLNDLADAKAVAKIAARIDRLAAGNPGDVAPVGEGVSELRIHHGPGYRVYFVRRGAVVAIILGGGTKKSQAADIEAAKAMAREL